MKKIPVYYFRHDFTAQDDTKILAMRMDLGWEGYGLFWAIVECLAQSGGVLPVSHVAQLSYRLQAKRELIERVLNEYGLFNVEDTITNQRLSDFLEFDMSKRKKMAENALRRDYKRKPTDDEPQHVVEHAKPKTVRKKPDAITTADVVMPYDTTTFRNAWKQWLEYRKLLRKPYKTTSSEQAALNQLQKYDEAFSIELIQRSIANGWQGLVFEGTDRAYEAYISPPTATKDKKLKTTDRASFNGLTAN